MRTYLSLLILVILISMAGCRTYCPPPLFPAEESWTTDPRATNEASRCRVQVLGAVAHPGAIDLDPPNLTVVQALALSGGLERAEDRYRVFLIRQGITYRVPVLGVGQQISALDPMLEPGDIVFVPESIF